MDWKEIADYIGFVILMLVLVVGVPWVYYAATGNLLDFGGYNG